MTENFPHQVLHSPHTIRIVGVLCGDTESGHAPGIGRVGGDVGAHSDLIDRPWGVGIRTLSSDLPLRLHQVQVEQVRVHGQTDRLSQQEHDLAYLGFSVHQTRHFF